MPAAFTEFCTEGDPGTARESSLIAALDTGDTRQGSAAGPPAGVKTEDTAAAKAEGKPHITGLKRVEADDESEHSDGRPAKMVKREEELSEPPKPVAVPRVRLRSRLSTTTQLRSSVLALHRRAHAMRVACPLRDSFTSGVIEGISDYCCRSLRRANGRSSRRSRVRTGAQLQPPLQPPPPPDHSRSVSPAST